MPHAFLALRCPFTSHLAYITISSYNPTCTFPLSFLFSILLCYPPCLKYLLQDGLRKVRKQIEIKTGSMASPPLIPTPVAAAAAASSEIEEVICHNEDLSSSSRAGESVGPDLQGPMFRKYFQTEEDDDDDLGGCLEPSGGSGGGGEDNSASVFEEEQVQLTSVSPEEFWSQVSQVSIQRAIDHLHPTGRGVGFLGDAQLMSINVEVSESQVSQANLTEGWHRVGAGGVAWRR